MIQLNLLPAVKLDYINAQKTRRLVLSISVIVTAISVAAFIILFSVDLIQKHDISNLNTNIKSQISQLKSKPDLNKILTIQNQLSSLTSLQSSKHAPNNLFNYLNELTPTTVNITNLTADFNANTLSITGNATSLDSVNQYIDAIKLTSYTINGSSSNSNSAKAFSSVVLSSFGTSSQSSGGAAYPASYNITLAFDPNLFQNTENVTLVVPNVTTTRLEQLQPTNLFATPTTNEEGAN